jgi:hypothetical protein
MLRFATSITHYSRPRASAASAPPGCPPVSDGKVEWLPVDEKAAGHFATAAYTPLGIRGALCPLSIEFRRSRDTVHCIASLPSIG